jgi:chemotaxis protein methyltransferase CheR
MAVAAANSEQWSEALSWLADAEAQHQLNPEIHFLRGVIELHCAEVDKALSSLRRAIYCDPGFVLAHYALGDLYQSEGKYRKAASQWQQAQALLDTAQPDAVIPFSDDLTVEMLSRLLQFRLDNLPIKS